MITKLPESQGSVLGVKISGKVTTEMEDDLIKTCDKVIQAHGKIDVLVFLDEHVRWGLKAGIEDLKWAMKHIKDIKKVAVVADSPFYKWYVALDKPFGKMVGIEEKYFKPQDLADAWSWIKE
jgi:hypothetical protein